ncbi:IS630 family transposase [Catellatospora vulcania]|uniref:IS630 family transposase n=1 Tax=Catellatospora vulcania TaxID=1460450 RepID=UPI0012D3A158|nr:IS630 family transposase [Catellatospora vulcania]
MAVLAVPVSLDEPTRAELQRIVRAGTSQVRRVQRVRIVLAAAEGTPNARIAADLHVNPDTVRKWRGRFAKAGLAALADAKRSGRPRRYGVQQRVRVVAVATCAPAFPEATWSHRRIAAHLADLAISASQVGRILADCDLRPHRVRGWITRRDDPLFWSRAADVCDLYLNPPPGAVVLSIDEKTAIAARSRKHPGQAAARGRPARQEFEYIRHGTVSIIAALEVGTGEVLTETITGNDAATFQRFLTMLDRSIDPSRQIHVVLDNWSSHVAKTTRAWLAAHPRWHVHPTPVHASWLNQVELYFSALTRRVLRHGDFSSRTDLINKIETYVIEKNTTTTPYRWTYDGTPLKAA